MQRQLNFELLRIMAMLGVVVNHFYTSGLQIYDLGADGFSMAADGVSDYLLWGVMELLKLTALVSVNCYILVSGYFMINHTGWRWRGMWRVWLQTFVYSVGLYVLLNLVQCQSIDLMGLAASMMPLWNNAYWFITLYLALMLVAPLLSRLTGRLNKRAYLMVLMVGGILVFQYPLGRLWGDYQPMLLFVYLYLLGGGIRKFLPQETPRRSVLLLSASAMLLLMTGYCVFKNLHLGNERFLIYAMEYNGAVLPLSVLAFLLFRGLTVPTRWQGTILRIAPLSLAVYLIHEHSSVNCLVWGFVGETYRALPGWLLPLYAIGFSVLIFSVCIGVEALRRRIFRIFNIN